MEITPRELEFCRLYAGSGNGTAAARKAGFSERSSHVLACRLLKRTEIQQTIARLRREWVQDAGLDIDSLVQQLITIAQQPSMATFIEQTPDGLIWKDVLSDEQLAAIKTTTPIKDVLGSWSSIELHDKATAIAALVGILQPRLSDEQRDNIIAALIGVGKKRCLTTEQLDEFSNLLATRAS